MSLPSPFSQNQKNSRFKLSHIELEAGILEAIYDNDTANVQSYLSYMQKELIGSRKSNKRKIYQSIIKKSRILAKHYKSDEILKNLARMPAKGSSPLSRNNDTFKVLNQLEIFQAIRKNNSQMIEKLLENTSSSMRQEVLSKGLGLACYFGHKNLMISFLEKGADIYHDNGDALRWIAREGKLDILKTLVEEHGVDMNMQNNDTLISAVIGAIDSSKEHKKIVEYLLDIGANIHARGNVALIVAIDNQRDDIVQILLNKGADMDEAFINTKYDITNNKFQKYWPIYQNIYKQKFSEHFGDDYNLKDLKKIIDNKTGITGLGMATKAGFITEVFKKIRENNDKLHHDDIKNMAGNKISGVHIFSNRGDLSKLFNATLWRHSPNSLQELWKDLPDKEKKQINLKILFKNVKSINLRHFIKNNHKYNGPKT